MVRDYLCGVMKKCLFVFVFFAVLLGQFLQAQSVALDTVVVQATRSAPSAWGMVLALDSTQRAWYEGGSVADWLGSASGLYLKNYGGSGLATLGLHGLPANQTQLWWNDLPLPSVMLGVSDVSLLPVGNNQVEVLQGNAALSSQAGAVGGAISLQTVLDTSQHRRGGVQWRMGSFGNYRAGANYSTSVKGWALGIQSNAQWSNNNFWYRNVVSPSPKWLRQLPEQAHQYHISPHIGKQVGKWGYISAVYWHSEAARQLQPPIVGSNYHEQQTDRSERALLRYHSWLGQRQLHQVTATAALTSDFLQYRNDTLQLQSNNTSHTWLGVLQTEHQLHPAWQWQTRLQWQHSSVHTNNYGNIAPPTQTQLQGSSQWVYQPTQRLQAQALLRGLGSSGEAAKAYFLPALSVAYYALHKAEQQWQLRASVARNARYPTLNDQYWYPGGKPQLKAEQSYTAEVGSQYRQQWSHTWALAGQWGAYYTHIDDFIAWLPTGNGWIWSPQNQKTVQAIGSYLQLQLNNQQSANIRWQVQTNYYLSRSMNLQSYNDNDHSAGKQLPYVPLHSSATQAQWQYSRYTLRIEHNYVGKRYTQTDNSYTSLLAAYHLLNAYASAQWQLRHTQLRLQVGVCNLTSTSYYMVSYRPMPLRTWQLNIQYVWNK